MRTGLDWKRSVNPANGGEKFNHDAGLEREAEVMGEKHCRVKLTTELGKTELWR